MVMQDFPLKDGQHLRIGSAPVTLGDGTALSGQGITPDIDVPVSEEAEARLLRGPFLVVSNKSAGNSATNQPSGDRYRSPGRGSTKLNWCGYIARAKARRNKQRNENARNRKSRSSAIQHWFAGFRFVERARRGSPKHTRIYWTIQALTIRTDRTAISSIL